MTKRTVKKEKEWKGPWTEYSSNNSGGSWWLSDDDWKNLERAGWEVKWFKDDINKYLKPDKNGRWLGGLASHALYPGTLTEAVDSFEKITGQSSEEEGCNCCGRPHYFYEREKREG